MEKENGKNAKEDSIIDMDQYGSHNDDVQLKEAPLKWFVLLSLQCMLHVYAKKVFESGVC